jgi:hypothetical protein
MTDGFVESGSRPQLKPSFSLILVMIILILIDLAAGSVVLFFQFTQFNLVGAWRRLLHIPILFCIQFPIATLLVGVARSSPERSFPRFLGIVSGTLSLPSLISASLSIVAFSLLGLGYVYGETCGQLVFEASSPDGSQVAQVYSGIGPAGFGPCNHVYIYYPDRPYLRRDVYASGEYWDSEAPDLVAWRSESVLYLAEPDTEIDLKREVGDLPIWASWLRALTLTR